MSVLFYLSADVIAAPFPKRCKQTTREQNTAVTRTIVIKNPREKDLI